MSKKIENMLKKLKALADDTRGNENERAEAQNRLRRLMEKHGITEEDLEIEVRKKRNFYFKDDWEHKLICQTIYKLFPEMDIYRTQGKKNWIWAEMTDAEYIEFEMHYCAYKASFQKEFDIFYYAFLSKNRIFPDKPPEDKAPNAEDKMSRGDLLRASMMAQGIESAQVRKLIGGNDNGKIE